MINNNDNNDYLKRMVLLCIAAASCVLLCFLVFIYSNDNKKPKEVPVLNKQEESTEEEKEVEYGKKNFTSSDLDFWNMDKTERVTSKEIDEDQNINTKSETSSTDKSEKVGNPLTDPKKDNGKKYGDEDVADSSMNNQSNTGSKNADNSNKILVELENGTSEYYEIDDSLKKNNYDFKKYLSNTEKGFIYSDSVCKVGVDISKYQGTIDFKKLKNTGIDFAMIRVGARGYTSGEIMLDEKFVEYASNAKMYGIPLGAYFYSMAKTDVEAIEEANYAVAACLNYGLTYPIALDMETVPNDSYRTENLTNKERTLIAKTFCNTVKTYGFKPIIYASKEYLITKLYLDELTDFDIWLCDPVANNIEIKAKGISDEVDPRTKSDSDKNKKDTGDSDNKEKKSDSDSKINGDAGETNDSSDDIITEYTNYPYWYSMWQYSHNGKVDGIDGPVDLNICFVNYDEN